MNDFLVKYAVFQIGLKGHFQQNNIFIQASHDVQSGQFLNLSEQIKTNEQISA